MFLTQLWALNAVERQQELFTFQLFYLNVMPSNCFHITPLRFAFYDKTTSYYPTADAYMYIVQ